MRSRNIKPGFFLNEKLAECDFETRLLFIGLWCYADREGRFEWIPKRIEAAIFPYDKKVNVEKSLCNLMSLHVITMSLHGEHKVGYIENFKKHQRPHPHEAQSALPEKPAINPCEQTVPGHVMTCNDKILQCPSDIRILGCSDIRNEDIIKSVREHPIKLFDRFWDLYPKKIKKGMCEIVWVDIFQSLSYDNAATLLKSILQAVKNQIETWDDHKYIPSPDNWLKDQRWHDVIIKQKTQAEKDKELADKLRKEMGERL